MFYFSLMLGKPVKNEVGRYTGRVDDMVPSTGEGFPRITHIIEKTSSAKRIVPWDRIKHIDHEGSVIRGSETDFPEFESDGEILLRRDILDKQIVDINGHRVVRVNDIQLNLVGGVLRLAGVDVGTPGLLRRLGFLDLAQKLLKAMKLKIPHYIIPWDNVQTLGTSDYPLKLTTTHKKLTKLHPADLADILEDLSGVQRTNLFRSLDTEKAAEIMEHLEEDAQVALFNVLPDELATDILEEMAHDEAVDLLQDLPPDRADNLLKLMEPDEAEDVKELLVYEEDTAGGLMSNEFVDGRPDMTCQQTIDLIRQLSPEAELVYYIYVTDDEGHLLGVLSLRDLIVHDPETRLEDIMIEEVVYVYDDAEMDQVIDLISKYDLLAMPVLDSDDKLKGIITFDDVMEILRPS